MSIYREEWDSFCHFSRVTEGCDFCHQDFGKGLEEEIFFFVHVWVTYLSQWREGEFYQQEEGGKMEVVNSFLFLGGRERKKNTTEFHMYVGEKCLNWLE